MGWFVAGCALLVLGAGASYVGHPDVLFGPKGSNCDFVCGLFVASYGYAWIQGFAFLTLAASLLCFATARRGSPAFFRNAGVLRLPFPAASALLLLYLFFVTMPVGTDPYAWLHRENLGIGAMLARSRGQ